MDVDRLPDLDPPDLRLLDVGVDPELTWVDQLGSRQTATVTLATGPAL